MKLDQLLQTNVLLDFYGGILTDNQKKIVRSYLDYNASLAEIAEELKISRQAVSDVLRRSIKKLEEMEEQLGLIKKYRKILEEVPIVATKITADVVLQKKINEEISDLVKTLED